MRRRYLLALALAGALLTACTKQPATTPAAPVSAPVSAPNPAGAESKAMLNDKAFAAIQQKDWATAISLAGQVVEQDPNYAPARFNLGLALYRTGKFTEALPHLEKAYELNTKQVEPGWFLALTLEEAGQAERAVTVLRELTRRFPGDQEVRNRLAALSPTPVLWRRLPTGSTNVTFLGARVVAAESPTTVAAFDQTGRELWKLSGEGAIATVVASDSGKLLAVVRDKSLDLVDAVTGWRLGTAPIQWEDRSGKGGPRIEWAGDMLYLGVDQWGASRYESTVWRIYRTTPKGLEEMATVAPALQRVQVSLDGQTAIIQEAGGARNLYVSGANTQTVAPVGDLVPGANLLYWNQDGRLFVHDFDRKKLVFSVDPVPGHTLWNPWPRTDGVWFVASKPTGGWAAYKEGELAFAGEGGVSGYYTDYLVVKNGDRTEVRDRTGKLVLGVPVHALQVRLTPDGQWAYTVTEGQVTAYRIP